MAKRRKSKNRIVIAFAIVSIIALVIVAVAGIFNVSAAPVFSPEPSGSLVAITSQNDLIKYAYEYNHGGHHPDDTLELGLANGSYYNLTVTEPVYDAEFESIGTSARPFNGKVVVPDNTPITIISDKALFDYVTTNVAVVNASDAIRELEFIRKSTGTDSPLFANHVENSAGSTAEWKIKIIADSVTGAETTTYSFAGVVGEIADSSKVKIEFTHDSVNNTDVASVVSASNVGVICGTLGAGAELTVNCTASATFDVRSTGGNAGGVAGVMGNESKLIFNSNFTLQANVTASADNKYAGGIAGVATNADIELNSATVDVSKTIYGKKGAGGVYGHYISDEGSDSQSPVTLRTFELDGITSSTGVSINGENAGGFIGYLEAENDITVTETNADITNDSFTKKVTFSGGTNLGGIIGAYSNTSLTKTLYFNNAEVNITPSSGSKKGGILGSIIGSNASYVKFNDVYVKTSGSSKLSGGIVASMGTNGSFTDFTGTAKVAGNSDSGLIRYQNSGVVRLAGTTNLTGLTYSHSQLVGERGNGLVYALGSGADGDSLTAGNWTFHRGTGGYDDIGDWGEVLRLKSSYNGLTESTFFTVDTTAHTVTMAGAVSTMASTADFIKTALNVQHNVSGQPAGGALILASGSASTSLLGSNLSLSADIDLTNTGMIAMTRDNGTSAAYTGTFSGNSHAVTLAIGETYGIGHDGNIKTEADIEDNNYGTIMGAAGGHSYLGLFAQSSNATFEDLTVNGFISVRGSKHGNDPMTYKIGGISAEAEATSGGTFTLDTVDTAQQIKLYSAGNSSCKVYCGGAIGIIKRGSAGTFDIGDSTFETAITEKRTASDDTFESYIGGAVGYDDSLAAHTVNFDRVNLAGTYSDTVSGTNKYKNLHYGGLISYITPVNVIDANTTVNVYGNISRKLNITDVTVKNSVSITTKVNGDSARTIGAGAFLGNEWHDVDTTITNLTVGESGSGAPTITVPSGSSAETCIGALVYKATGHMLVDGVTVNKATVTSAVNSSFGFVVNDAVNRSEDTNKSALYLELMSNNYNIAALDFSNSGTDVYDEIAAFSHFSDKNIEDNGNAVVSIRIGASGDAITMNGSACNTYQNQTTYGKNTVTENANTRYYYNLDVIRAKASPSDAEKMLLWSLYKYSHSTVRANYFSNSYNNRISGNCDMVGLSYYPVDASGVTISANTTVKFYNNEIETGESGTGNSDSAIRSTHVANKSQHYLMHEAIFYNYSGSLDVDDLTLQGNVSNDDGKSGFIVRNMLGNTDTTSRIDIDGVVLDGAVINGSGYAPLLINDIGRNVKLDMAGVKANSGSYNTLISNSGYAASSLIGNVGDDSATNINLTFSNMVLDARTAALSNASVDTALTTAYGTSRTIFSRATFLNNFAYLNGSRAEYNYEYEEDHTAPLHQVTYAKEVKDSVEYAGREDHYYGDSTHYTDPTGTCTSAFNFSSGFRPHVYNYDGNQILSEGNPAYTHYHEVRVNLKDTDLTTGCGQYNDPYVITDGTMLSTIAKIISGTPDNGIKIKLPDDMTTADMWCVYAVDNTSATKDRDYTYDSANSRFVADDGVGSNKDLTDVRKYLAGAYYSIESDITLPSDYIGLGEANWTATDNTKYECPYSFRGVIVGHNNILTNSSDSPLIVAANGCVVKELTVTVSKEEIEITQFYTATTSSTVTDAMLFDYNNNSCKSYGAVIGKVMGGDNIIDHVSVSFTSTPTFTFTLDGTNRHTRLVPVGGYIGVVLNGGVIFRNMSGINTAGLTAANCANGEVADESWLYVNPIIGRVIAGYAFTESSSYQYNEANVTMKNGTKNYSIPDFNKNAAKLSVTASSAATHVISIPNGQALTVLSYIVNSGAGSATYNASSEQDYASVNGTAWIAYRNYSSTRCANYDQVGTSAPQNGDYATVAAQDVYSGKNKIPYIIRNYTEKDGTLYRARSICGASTVSSMTFGSGTYSVGAGFRGINSIYLLPTTSTACRIQFNSVSGSSDTNNPTIINLAMKYQDFNHRGGTSSGNGTGTTTYNNIIENYQPFENAGFGLFNNAYLSGFSASSDTNSIKDLTITGSVFYDIRKLVPYGSETRTTIRYAYGWHKYNYKDNEIPGKAAFSTGYYPDVADRIESSKILNVGGIAGTASSSIYLKNIYLDSLSVEAAKYTGGMIGFAQGNEIVIKDPSSSSLSVKGGMFAGGLVGGHITSNSGKDHTITGSLDNIAEIDITEVCVKGEPSPAKLGFTEFSDMIYSAGGLCGIVNTSTSKTLTVQYVKVVGDAVSATYKGKLADDLRYKIATGGLFGRLKDTKAVISDCSVESVEVDGDLAGGVIGYISGNQTSTFTNITVKGSSGKSIDAANMAGGFCGFIYSSSVQIKIDNLHVSDYGILSSNASATRPAAGGMIGVFYSTSNWSNDKYFDISNSSVVNCSIYIESGDTRNSAHAGVGGFIAYFGTKGKITGHNLLSNNVTLSKSSGNTNPEGTVLAKNDGVVIKLVGVSLQNGDAKVKKVIGNKNATDATVYGTDGYVIMADYDGVCTDDSKNTSNSTLYNNTTNPKDHAAADPYVTVNPPTYAGTTSTLLTGDGIASNVTDLPIQDIRTSTSAADKRYELAYGNQSTFNRYTGKLSTYNTEQNASLANDFTVLVVDDVSKTNTTEMINSYINLLANTNRTLSNGKGGYAENVSGFYDIQIYRMELDGSGNFVKYTTNVNLKKDTDNNQFYMDINSVDTAGPMFSLIDVRYYDPVDNTKIAYHLYVPVIVKKMLTFDFEIATGSGTNYKRSWYNDRFGEPLMENLGTPVTIFFKYSYLRTQSEWTAAVNNGENMLRNYDKVLTLSKSGAVPDLPGDTLLVLVDPNNGGKPYYAQFRDVYSNGILTLSDLYNNHASNFKTNIDGTGTSFEPVYLNDMLNITAALDNTDGKMVIESTAANATVKATLNGTETYFRPATEAELSESGINKYTLTVTNANDATSGYVPINEMYYISFFTDTTTSNVIYHYVISTNRSFNDPRNPSRIRSLTQLQDETGTAHLILGNIFNQTGYSITSTTPDTSAMTYPDNHSVTMNMSVNISIYNNTVLSEIRPYLSSGSGIYVYQSFITNLTRNDEDGTSRKMIGGSPTATVNNYQISSSNGSVANSTSHAVNVGVNNVEIQATQSLNEYLISGTNPSAHITAQLVLTYSSEESIAAQFPNRIDANVDVGTKISGSSNIAFDLASTAYSSSTTGERDDLADHSYYCNIDTDKASLSYNVKSTVFEGDYGPLGINPLDSAGVTELHVSTLAIYDITNIAAAAADYDQIKCTLTLYKRSDDYATKLSFPTYMNASALRVGGYSISDQTQSSNTEYVFYLSKSSVASSSSSTYDLPVNNLAIPIDFYVKTGSELEALNLDYSNYKIYLEVELVKDDNGTERELPASRTHNFIIYTNARIIPDFIG